MVFAQNNIGVGTINSYPSAVLDLTAIAKGFLTLFENTLTKLLQNKSEDPKSLKNEATPKSQKSRTKKIK